LASSFSPPENRVLLLQRSATERQYPNIWEFPSGKVESWDESILAAAARECKEETALTVPEFVRELKSFEYFVEGRGKMMQLNFEVIVDGEDVVISDEERQAYG
jgi:8-oxo-dGTP pyrophosphatase MutT (NUDIX family)